MGQPAAHTSSLARHHLIGLGFWQAWQMAAFCSDAIIADTPYSSIPLKTLAIACTTLGLPCRHGGKREKRFASQATVRPHGVVFLHGLRHARLDVRTVPQRSKP